MEKYIDLFIAVVSVLWAASLWFLNKKQRGSDIQKTDSEAMSTLRNTLDDIVQDMTDLTDKYTTVLEKVRARDEKIDALESKFAALKRDYEKLKKGNKILMDQLIEHQITPNWKP